MLSPFPTFLILLFPCFITLFHLPAHLTNVSIPMFPPFIPHVTCLSLYDPLVLLPPCYSSLFHIHILLPPPLLSIPPTFFSLLQPPICSCTLLPFPWLFSHFLSSLACPGQEKIIFFLGAQPGDKNFLQTNGVFLY